MSKEFSGGAQAMADLINKTLETMTTVIIQSHLCCLSKKQEIIDVLTLLHDSEQGDIIVTQSAQDMLDVCNIPIGTDIYTLNTNSVNLSLALTEKMIVKV